MTDKRIEEALDMAFQFGQVDGSHHKMWVIDQMVRALTGRTYNDFVETYKEFNPDTGEYEYEWDTGTPP